MTRCTLKSVRNKNKLNKAFLKNPDNKKGQKYTKYKNRFNHIIKAAKKTYYEEQLIMHKENSKMIWNTLNQIPKKPNKTSKIAKTVVGNNSSNIIDDPKDIANKFNDYFVNIGPNLAKQINNNNHETFEKFLYGSYQSSLKFQINNNFIKQVKTSTFLGIVVDEFLTWHDYIDLISKKVSNVQQLYHEFDIVRT